MFRRVVNSRLVGVLCQSFYGYPEVQRAGAAGSIFLNDYQIDKVSFVVALLAVAISPENFTNLHQPSLVQGIYKVLLAKWLFHFCFIPEKNSIFESQLQKLQIKALSVKLELVI